MKFSYELLKGVHLLEQSEERCPESRSKFRFPGYSGSTGRDMGLKVVNCWHYIIVNELLNLIQPHSPIVNAKFPKTEMVESNTLVSSGMTEWWIISTLLAMVGSSPSGLLPSSSQASPSSRSASSLPSPTPTQWTSSLKSLSSTRKYRGRTWNVWLFF